MTDAELADWRDHVRPGDHAMIRGGHYVGYYVTVRKVTADGCYVYFADGTRTFRAWHEIGPTDGTE